MAKGCGRLSPGPGSCSMPLTAHGLLWSAQAPTAASSGCPTVVKQGLNGADKGAGSQHGGKVAACAEGVVAIRAERGGQWKLRA